MSLNTSSKSKSDINDSSLGSVMDKRKLSFSSDRQDMFEVISILQSNRTFELSYSGL